MSTNGIYACQKGSSNVLKILHNMMPCIVLSMSAHYFFIFYINIATKSLLKVVVEEIAAGAVVAVVEVVIVQGFS